MTLSCYQALYSTTQNFLDFFCFVFFFSFVIFFFPFFLFFSKEWFFSPRYFFVTHLIYSPMYITFLSPLFIGSGESLAKACKTDFKTSGRG